MSPGNFRSKRSKMENIIRKLIHTSSSSKGGERVGDVFLDMITCMAAVVVVVVAKHFGPTDKYYGGASADEANETIRLQR